MQITCISGSPRVAGNTASVLNEMIKPLKEKGNSIIKYNLSLCNIKYCTGCKSCIETRKCIHDDDVEKIVEDIFESELVIIASPSYWGDVTGQMKVFIDRCTPYCNTNKEGERVAHKTKGIAVAVRAGKNKKENENLVNTIEHFLGHLDIPLISSFTVEGIDSIDDLKNSPHVLKNAYDFALNLI